MKPLYINQKGNLRPTKNDCPLWDIDKIMLELNAKDLPESIVLNGFEKIENIRIIIDNNEGIARHNNGNRTFDMYYKRLVKLNELINKI